MVADDCERVTIARLGDRSANIALAGRGRVDVVEILKVSFLHKPGEVPIVLCRTLTSAGGAGVEVTEGGFSLDPPIGSRGWMVTALHGDGSASRVVRAVGVR